MTALALVFSKIVSEDKRSMTIFIQVIFNEIDIHDLFKSVYSTIIWNIQKSLGKDLGLIINLVIDYIFSISKYNPLAGSRYIKLPKEWDYQRKGLINI